MEQGEREREREREGKTAGRLKSCCSFEKFSFITCGNFITAGWEKNGNKMWRTEKASGEKKSAISWGMCCGQWLLRKIHY
jgi:hypothetical protein